MTERRTKEVPKPVPVSECRHEMVVPCGNGFGRCTTCGDDSFPLSFDAPRPDPLEEWPEDLVAHADFGNWRIALLASESRSRVVVSHVHNGKSIRWLEQKPNALTDWIGKLVAEAEVMEDICGGHMRDAIDLATENGELKKEIERLREQAKKRDSPELDACGRMLGVLGVPVDD